ncbi:MAG: cell division protein ZapA [Gammaproteobacteria bacterium]|nr:cell division protein ZapA [Gammaproteobacteria bacterium]
MSNKNSNSVAVHILDKEYQVVCAAEERDELLLSARHLDRKMRDIREGGKVIGTDRIAVIAALNLAHELLQQQQQSETQNQSVGHRIQTLQKKVEQITQNSRQLEL